MTRSVRLLQEMAEYMELAERDQVSFQLQEMIKGEHRPLVAFWMMGSNARTRSIFSEVPLP